MSAVFAERVRRGILDVLHEIGGEHSHAEIAAIMNEIGHRVSRRDVIAHIDFLSQAGLVTAEKLDLFTVATLTADGVDAAEGTLRVEGVARFKAGA